MKKSFERFYPLVVFLFASLLYVNTIPNDYNLDDELVTINHRNTSKGIEGVSDILNSFYYEDEMGYKYGYRPITHISFALEHQIFGENPHLGHAINVILYALLCLIIFYLTQKLAPDRGPLLALFVAIVFAVHPIHTEVVASIKNRDEILSLLFGVLSWLTFLKIETTTPVLKKVIFLGLSVSLFALGILSKQSIVFFAILVPLAYRCFKEGSSILFPLFYLSISSILVKWVVDVSYIQLALFFLFGCLLLLIRFKIDFNGIKEYLKAFLEKKPTQIVIILLLSVLWGVALNFNEVWFNSLVFFLSILGVFYYKETWTSLIISSLFLVFFLYVGFENRDENAMILALCFLILLNQKLLLKLKKVIIGIGLLILIVFVILDASFVKEVGLVTQVVIIVIGFLYFRPLWGLAFFIAVRILFANTVDWTSYSLTIVLVLLFVPFIISWFKEFKWIDKINTLSYVFVFLGGIILLNNTGLNSLEVIEEVIPVVAEVENVGFEVNPDRPLLPVENPLIEDWSIQSRWSAMASSNIFYLKKLIIPFPMLFYYGYNQIEIHEFNSWQIITFSLITCLLGALSFFLLWKKNFYIGFALLFLLLNLIPYSNLFTPVAGVVGERLVFTASLGFSLILGVLLYWLYNKEKNRLLILVFSGLVLGSAVMVLHRNSIWKNKYVLFTHDIKHNQKSAIANALLADIYFKEGVNSASQNEYIENSEKSIYHYNQAIEIYPDLLNWWFLKGEVEFNLQKNKEAILSLNKSIEMDPAFSHLPYRYLGIMYDGSNQFTLAIQNYEIALRMEPFQEEMYNNLAISYLKLDQFDNAISTLERGLTYYPKNYDINLNMGKMFATYGNQLEALRYYKSARSINNTDSELTRQIDIIESELVEMP